MNITVIVSKALNKENWKKGVNYLNKYGVKGFIRKLKHLSPDTDYNLSLIHISEPTRP